MAAILEEKNKCVDVQVTIILGEKFTVAGSPIIVQFETGLA